MGAGTGGLRDGSLQVESRGKATVGSRSGDEVSQKLKEHVKLARNFNVFLYKM